MSSNIIIFGAPDPEQIAAEKIALQAGWEVWFAVGPDRKRVHPGNAYAATGAVNVRWEYHDAPRAEKVYLFECGFVTGHLLQPGLIPIYHDPHAGEVFFCSSGAEEFAYNLEVVRIDHHRPGDPGFGVPPERFLEGSSLGQVMSVLAVGPATAEQAMVAAADHCLEAAYRGRCPGVDPDALMRWRAASRAELQKRPRQDVLADIETARRILRQTITEAVAGTTADTHPLGEFAYDLADLRGHHIPELPEAACREGIPFLSTVRDRDGREKVVLQAAPPDLVRRFLAGELVPGLCDYYGSPERGMAGGYLAQETP